MIKPEQLPALYKNLFTEGLWTSEYIDALIKNPSEPEDYPHALIDIKNCIDNISLANKRILIVGSISPWIECFLLYKGANKVSTADVNPIQIEDSRIEFIYSDDICKHKFDIVVSFSSIEHIGLGRYGDAIDSDGDIKFMNQMHDVISSDGIFIVGIPVAEEYVLGGIWHRIYDSNRISQLFEKYDFVMSSKNGIINNKIDYTFDSFYEFDWQNQPCIVIKPK